MDISSSTAAASSSTVSNFYSNNTMTGLVDGINVDSIVSGLMVSARAPQDTLNQNLQTLQWQQQDYQSINTDLQSLQTTASSLELQGTFLTKQASSSSSAVIATAGISALDTSHTVAVTSVATNAVLTSSSQITAITSADSDLSTLLGSNLTTDSSGNVDFTINDGASTPQQFSVDPSTTTLNDVVNDINNSGLNVQASWDSTLQRFYLTDTQPGQTVTAQDTGGNLMQQLFGGTEPSGGYTASGTGAAVTVDGTSYTFDSNQFTINGVSYSLAGTTSTADPATVTVSNNTSAVVSTIQNFVTAYNSTLTDINNMLTQPVYAGYTPLTQDAITAQNLDTTQVDAWNTKAQSGQLNSDPLLQSVMNNMRQALSTPVSGLTGQVTVTNDNSQQVTATCNQLGVIGISPSTSYTAYGQLTVNTDQLTQALQSNPQAVMALFTTSLDSSGNLLTDSNQQGVGTRLFNTLANSISQITDQAGTSGQLVDNSFIGTEIASDNTQISTWGTRLNDLEQNYYTEYDAMETTLSQLNSESSWLTEEFSSSSSSS
jgi:flagellar hook-associated protein 2